MHVCITAGVARWDIATFNDNRMQCLHTNNNGKAREFILALKECLLQRAIVRWDRVTDGS